MGLDLEQPVSAKFQDLPLTNALMRLIDLQSHWGVIFNVRGGGMRKGDILLFSEKQNVPLSPPFPAAWRRGRWLHFGIDEKWASRLTSPPAPQVGRENLQEFANFSGFTGLVSRRGPKLLLS